MFKARAGVDLVHVPYKSTPLAIQDTMSGHVQMCFADPVTALPQVKAGTVRCLGVGTRTRYRLTPDIPTLIETKLSNYEAEIFYGMVVPAKTPPQMTAQLVDWFTAAMNAPEVKPRLGAQGLFSNIVCGKAFGDQMRKQVDEYTTIAREANIKME